MTYTSTYNILTYKVFSGELDGISPAEKQTINTINPHSYVVAKKDMVFRQALLESDILLPDGIGIVMANRLINKTSIKKVAGSDIHMHLLAELNKTGGKCFYLGASEATLQKIKERLDREFPAVKADYYSPPFKKEFSEADNEKMIEAINAFSPDVLFVGMTAPKQEKWVHENKQIIDAKIICSVGAVFDFFSGTKKRPGKFWIAIGLEFLPRLLREPTRLWKRNIVSTPLFLYDVILNYLRVSK
jgi:N-acetylglucosaminyldiphosphoundecaprenol N-acetyl-beta-D-mannosaminyltransferase